MERYGYFMSGEVYSDVSEEVVKAVCPHCGRRWIANSEDAWENKGRWFADDLCSEYDEADGNFDLRGHE